MSKRLVRFDWAMKTILRDKANFDVLEGFLSALLEDDNIKILQLLESESNQPQETDKFNRVDLLVEDSNKRKIFIEIQNTRESDYMQRILFGSSKIIVEHQKIGKDFKNVSKVISISILYFNLGHGDDYLYYGTTEFRGLNTGNPLIVKERIETTTDFEPKYQFVEKKIFPEYYLITVERYKNIVRKRIDEWIYIFKNSEVKEGSTSKNIDKAEQKLAELNMTPEEKKAYERYMINAVVESDMFDTARVDGWIEGNDLGKLEGREEGREEGKIEGKIEVARQMKLDGMDYELISKFTGLTIADIEQL